MAIDTNTPDKPELIAAGMKAGLSQAEAFLAVFRFWRWATSHSEDGTLPVGVDAIAVAAGIPEPFVSALVDVGWLSLCGGRCIVPAWDRRFSKGAKALMKNAERQGRYRRGGGGKKAKTVTPDRYDGVTRPLPDRPTDHQPEEDEVLEKSASQTRGRSRAHVSAKRAESATALRVQRADFGFRSMTDTEHARARAARLLRCRMRAEGDLAARERRTGLPWTSQEAESLAAQYVESEIIDDGRRELEKQA